MIIALIVLYIIVFLISGIIAKPLIVTAEHLEIISKADFTKKISDKLLKRKDELGGIAASTNLMQNSIKDVVRGIVYETSDIGKYTEDSTYSINELNLVLMLL